MPSFDVVSQVDLQEVRNAVDQAARELANRYDFRGTETAASHTDGEITVESSAEGRLDAANQVLREKLVKRGIDVRAISGGEPKQVGGGRFRSVWSLQQGIPQDAAKELAKMVRDAKLKVQASIQGDQVRVQGKKRDDLQQAISLLKESNYRLPLQYINFRD